MKSKSEVLHAVKEFAKEVGAPNMIVSNPSREQMSQPLRKFCSQIGTALKHIEVMIKPRAAITTFLQQDHKAR